MADCPQLARTSAYFDGALAPDEEAAAAAHLAECAACQALLGDAVVLDAALADAKRSPTRARRWPLVAGMLAVAAAGAVVIAWPRERASDVPHSVATLELPRDRVLEVRFAGERFAAHRPRAVARTSSAPREEIPLAMLAELERQGATHDLVAALAASGDLARARDLAAKLPDDARGAIDRAALALAAGDPEDALAHAQRALDRSPEAPAAWWNLGLATRELGLTRTARAAFARIAASTEPGWSTEARGYADALARELAVEDELAAFDARGKAMLDGGAPLTADDVAQHPAFARIYFYDAARLAPDRARLEALRPLAAAIDRSGSNTAATAALERIDPAITSRHTAAYRAVLARTASADEAARLISALQRAGRGADDMRAGAIILSRQAGARLDELRDLVTPWNDPWFGWLLEREGTRTRWPAGDLRAESALRDAVARCTGDAWAMRCGQLAQDLAELLLGSAREEAAEPFARTALERFRVAVAPVLAVRARALLADLHRLRGRVALARAELEEVQLAAGPHDCDIRRYSQISEAELAIVAGDFVAASAALPTPEPPEGCSRASDIVGIATAIDIARATADPRAREVAQRWLATAGDLAAGGLATIGAFRLGTGSEAAVTTWLAAHRTEAADQAISGVRAWGVTTLVDNAGTTGRWAAVLAAVNAPNAGCVVVASVDDDRLTVAARTPTAVLGEHRRVPVAAQATATLVGPAITAALATCPDIAVVALPPLHGRADLLPAELPWWFAGDAPPSPPPVQPGRALQVTDTRPPDPALPRLAPVTSRQPFEVRLTGAAATPRRVLAALADATYAELHAHGIAATRHPDAAYLALSPEADGRFVLHANDVASAKLSAHPVVVLAACRAAAIAPYLRERWSLPDALLDAGASAVIAADVDIPDAEAGPVFDELHRRIASGEPVAAALAAVRRDASAVWVKHLVVFR